MAVSRRVRLKIVIILTTLMFFGEIIFGYITHSIALVTDAFHMLSDIAALTIAHYAITLSESKKVDAEKNTFGWQRAETLGALINSVFLLALCFTIFLSAIQRFFEPVVITQPLVVLGVGSVGLLVNIIGLFLFSDAHNHMSEAIAGVDTMEVSDEENQVSELPNLNAQNPPKVPNASQGSLNMRGAFLHILGDALGSIGVIISAIIIKWSNWEQSYYMDPIVSILIATIIVCTTWNLFRRTSDIVLHVVPPSVSIGNIRKDISKLSYVEDLHELHVWQLSDHKIIASVHVILKDGISTDYMEISNEIKKILHSHSIHNTTVQLETTDGHQERKEDDNDCLLTCKDNACQTVTCCNDNLNV